MLLRHLGSAMDAARIAAGAHPLVVFVAHQHEAGFPVLGENHLFQICKKTALTRRFPKPARPGCQGGEPCRRGSR